MTSNLPEVHPRHKETPAVGADNIPILADSVPLTPARRAWVESVTIVLLHKWLILAVTVIVTAATAFYAFTAMPNVFTAHAVILPARHAGGGGLDAVTSGISSTLKDIGLAKLKGGEDSYSPLSLMRSRELQEGLVKQFHFQQVYDAPTMDDAIKQFATNLDGELTEEGNFIVSFQDTSRQRAAEVTNAVVDAINNINSRLAKEEAVHNLTYVEERYNTNVADLDSAEAALGAFQRKFGVFSITEQARAEMTALAELEGQKSMAEIGLHNAQQMYGSNSSEAAVYRSTIEQLSSKLGEMQVGMDTKASSFVPTNSMPDVALSYLRLMREVEIQSKLKAFLLPSLEQAKLDENRDLYGFVTLDHAVPPSKKSGPHRSMILLQALIGSMVISSIAVILSVNVRRARVRFQIDRERLSD
ncbi:MAG: Wzz/FepE/Etk N-terminal domain-containing protein [Bacteroidota bacterium]|nr:Wzz/FepE/Etk N-terminal domain-containing protein [Bacteroidota bacterium]MDP4233039.1 Wzz/FepE/Etk N-terminal domain-containing protein [Bacteroidota bacterium]MDP4241816.1 Wzz/FepE/Etk N-terminal domain-containing protein [Bacteroidota bacterium]MDP4288763.1 Wzz/FepE/Etk N-terminal domain-containing protein [Bacteroidota bacterium]